MLWRKVITQGIDNSVIISDGCYDKRGEELVHEPTGDETMERSMMNQNEDDHSGGQEETRGSRLCGVMLLMIVVMVIIGSHDDSLPH